jgi:hypothetical protein
MKDDLIELKEKAEINQRTSEEKRKIIPKEVKSLKFILSNHSGIIKYSWETDGYRVILN